MRSLNQRVEAEELLDRTDLDVNELERSLSDLEFANRWLGGIGTLRPFFMPLISTCSSFLDLGCGGGDILRFLSREGHRRGRELRLAGIDISPAIVAIAKERCAPHANIKITQADARNLPYPNDSFDVVFSSTFLHHFSSSDAVDVLKEASRVARKRVIMSDLIRSHAGRIGVSLIGDVLFGRLSRADGRTSFMRSYRPAELKTMAAQAGMISCKIHRSRFCRMTLVYDVGVGSCG